MTTAENTWEKFKRLHPIGSSVTGQVVLQVPFGVFLQLEPDIIGLLRVPEFARGGLDPSNPPPLGHGVTATVLAFNERLRQVDLGFYQQSSSAPDP